MVTIKDIAREANVSEGTVDRVIHNRGGVSKKTEARVKTILAYHNFSVNPIASALAMKNKHIISVLIPEYNDADVFWKSPYLGIQKAEADVKNFGVNVNTFTYNQYSPSSYLKTFKLLLETKPTAVVMVPNFSKETTQFTEKLDALNIPYLFLNIDIKGYNNLTYVGQDAYTAGYIAGKLIALNCQKSSEFLIIEVKNNSTKNNAVHNRVKGFHDYFIKNEIDSKPQTLKIDSFKNSMESKEIINSYLELHPEIKGIFVPSSRIHNVVDYLDNDYIKKLALIGFDNTTQNNACLLKGAVSFLISQKPFDQGYESIRLLTDFIIHKKTPEQEVYMPIDILIKENVQYNNANQLTYQNEE